MKKWLLVGALLASTSAQASLLVFPPFPAGSTLIIGEPYHPWLELFLPGYSDPKYIDPPFPAGTTTYTVENYDSPFIAFAGLGPRGNLVQSGVPELSTWAMLGLGFGLIFAFKRRKAAPAFQ